MKPTRMAPAESQTSQRPAGSVGVIAVTSAGCLDRQVCDEGAAAGRGRCPVEGGSAPDPPRSRTGRRAGGASATVSDVRAVGERAVAAFEVSGAPPLRGYVGPDVGRGERYPISLNPAGVTPLRLDA